MRKEKSAKKWEVGEKEKSAKESEVGEGEGIAKEWEVWEKVYWRSIDGLLSVEFVVEGEKKRRSGERRGEERGWNEWPFAIWF